MSLEEDNINELLQSSEILQIPNIIQELFHKMNLKIESLTNKVNLLEHNCTDIATKEHLNTIIATKVDIQDFLKTVNNIDQHIKQKPSIEEIKYLSEEKISKSDLNTILSNYVHKNDLEDYMEINNRSNDYNNIKNSTNNNVDSLIIEINKKINSMPNFKDIEKINNTLAKKANLIDVKNNLAQKADKNEIIEMIKNKVDMNYFDNQLKKKLDIYIWDKMQNDLNLKTNLEDIDKIQEELDKKIDIESINNLMKVVNNKLDKKDINNFIDELTEKQQEIYDTKFKALDIDFDRFIESVKAQFNNVNQALNKLSKDKLDKTFFEERLNMKLDNKKLASEIDKQTKEIKSRLNDIIANSKENMENINSKIEEIKTENENQIEGLKDDIRNIIKELNTLTNNSQYNFDLIIKEKNAFDFYKNETTNKIENLFDKMESKIDINLFNKNMIKIQEELKSYINNIAQDKITYNEVENIIKNINKKNSEDSSQNKQDFNNKINEINNQLINLEKNKINIEQLNDILENKINEINNEINKRVLISDFSNLNNKIRQMNDAISRKTDEKVFEENNIHMNKIIQEIKSDIINTYNKKELDILFNEKCNLNTFNTVIKEINNLLETKISIVEYQKYIDIQEIINNIYLTENATGIWKWVSTKLKNGYVPLEIEYYNTMRDNYLWEEDRTSLMIINKGVYNIKIIFFAYEQDINVTLVINGENLITKGIQNNREDNIKNNKFIFQRVEIDEYISINDKVRVSILFKGKSINARGYMKISSVHYEQEKDFDIKNAKFVEERLCNNQNRTFPIAQDIDMERNNAQDIKE